jgi:restriction system protein
MSRRNRKSSSALDDIIEITSQLPWWVGVVLAITSYLFLHWIATSQVVPAGNIKNVGTTIFGQLIRVFAMAGQYILPLLFVIGAGVSAVSHKKMHMSDRRDALPSSRKERAEPTLSGSIPSEDAYELWKGADVSEKPRPDKWSIELLRVIDWKRFEELCAEYFRVCGFHATTQSHGPDGGIDIKLYAPNDRTRIENIVQCKQWTRAVGPKPMRELLGVMTATRVARGVFVTSSTFNDEATKLAGENRIHLLDGRAFLNLILGRPPADQTRLLQVATEGDYLTPSCPSCGSKLVDRENKKDKSHFWACPNFPRCRYTLSA